MITFEVLTALPKTLSSTRIKRVEKVLGTHVYPRHRGQISLSFFSEAKMKALNRATRGKNKPTDVLSYPATKASGFASHKGEALLGDIVICVPYAAREAKRRSLPIEEELVRLLIHGTLHIRGFDHDTEPKEAKMFRLQEELVEQALI